MINILKNKYFLLFLISCICHKTLTAQDLSKYLNNERLVLLDSSYIQNALHLQPFFKKLKSLDTTENQFTIVHIGDSHIQGPYFPNTIREQLQMHFGNAGRGFIFPYRVAKTNGAIDEKFKGVGDWHTIRNVKSNGKDNIGLSGILLETNDTNFLLELSLNNKVNTDSLQLITENQSLFKLCTINDTDILKTITKTKEYTIKSGDNLGKIAQQFSTTVSKIKKENRLDGNVIYAGQKLKIPTGKKITSLIETVDFKPLTFNSKTNTYFIPRNTTQLYIKANKEAKTYRLDGILLKNETSGIRYDAIGVNGAKYSDYSKFPIFFKQLKKLQSDLIILSLGTNESFYENLTTEQFIKSLKQFKALLKTNNITTPVLVTSPPPSMIKRKKINNKATLFASVIQQFALTNNWAFYNLHGVCGTSKAMPFWAENKLTSRDKIHFTKDGYTLQGYLFTQALLQSFNDFN